MRFLKIDKKEQMQIALLLGLLVAILWGCRFSQFAQTAADVRQNTLRLHIRADSDSPADQALKLEVRDAILAQSDLLFAGAENKDEAVEKAQSKLPQVEQIARNTLLKEGCQKSVKARVVRMYFDTTAYEDFTLPAGEYDALRVEIGSGKGHNWFCVLYPELCLPAAEGERVYPETEQQQLVKETPVIRFAALELFQKLFGSIHAERYP